LIEGTNVIESNCYIFQFHNATLTRE